MSRLKKCIGFQFKSMAKSTSIFICIYILVCAVILLFLSFSIHGSFNSGFYIGCAVFVFVYVIASYRESFNYLLMFSNTRKNIFLSSAVTFAAMSIFLAVISIFSIQFDGIAARVLEYSGISHSGLISLMYDSSNMAAELLWFTTFFILICSFSILYSSLAYKLGKVFITLFWVFFGVSWIVLPATSGIDGVSVFFNTLKAFFCIGVPNGILLAPVNFTITAVILGAAAYLISSRQPQNV